MQIRQTHAGLIKRHDVPGVVTGTTSKDLLMDVEASLRKVWDEDGPKFTEADWEALYKDAIAGPCFERGYSVACTLTRRRDHRPLVAKTPAFDKYGDLFAGKEQALDLLAVDRTNLVAALGAEIEWSANRKHKKPEDDEVVSKLWGHLPPHDGYLADILYDLGRLLAFNPPHMVLITYSSLKVGPKPVADEVRSMYRRVSNQRGKGRLLLMVDGNRAPPFPLFRTFSPDGGEG